MELNQTYIDSRFRIGEILQNEFGQRTEERRIGQIEWNTSMIDIPYSYINLIERMR